MALRYFGIPLLVRNFSQIIGGQLQVAEDDEGDALCDSGLSQGPLITHNLESELGSDYECTIPTNFDDDMPQVPRRNSQDLVLGEAYPGTEITVDLHNCARVPFQELKTNIMSSSPKHHRKEKLSQPTTYLVPVAGFSTSNVPRVHLPNSMRVALAQDKIGTMAEIVEVLEDKGIPEAWGQIDRYNIRYQTKDTQRAEHYPLEDGDDIVNFFVELGSKNGHNVKLCVYPIMQESEKGNTRKSENIIEEVKSTLRRSRVGLWFTNFSCF